MGPNCEKSCAPKPTEAAKADKNENCGYWAGIGECTANVAWMSVNCEVSCAAKQTAPEAKPTEAPAKPTEAPKPAVDANENCVWWASVGECQSNPTWMNTNCAIACGKK
jgi:hypothetical protein